MTFRLYLSLFFTVLFSININAQYDGLPKVMTEEEKEMWPQYLDSLMTLRQTGNLPDQPVRVMGEWEEIQALFITWRSFPAILTEIVRHAVDEVKVYIITQNEASVTSTLTNAGVPLDNVEFMNWPSNSVWIRDYGPWAVYENDVEQLAISDYIYNRPRPNDNMVPRRVAEEFGVPWYAAIEAPFNLVHTGGNNLVDGYKTGYSSKIIFRENPGKTEEEIDFIGHALFGYENYIKFDELPFDGISHLDMHMRFIDEETVIIGEYPEGVADGPFIDANIEYLLNNHSTSFGNPYEIIRIPMPPGPNGNYPDAGGPYRTFTNSIFLNGTILVPIYEEKYDTIGLRIYRESLPGYNVVGIDCNAMINSLGALHCITKTVGVEDPLWIAHPRVRDFYTEGVSPEVTALVKHRDGIESANVFYRLAGDSIYQQVEMTAISGQEDWYSAEIPGYDFGSEVQYYIQAVAGNGKVQNRPIVAPEGYFHYRIVEPESAPLAAFSSNIDEICPGGSVRFLDRSEGGVFARQWIFEGGIPSFSTELNPEVQYPASGSFDVLLVVENHLGVDTLLLEDYVLVTGGMEPYMEDFSAGIPGFWRNFDNANSTFLWEHFDQSNCSNNNAIVVDNYQLDSRGAISTFSNTFDLSDMEEPRLFFSLAYAPYDSDFFDGLEVIIETCDGESAVLFREFGESLASVPATTDVFFPEDCSQWRHEIIDIQDFAGSIVTVSFKNLGGWGNLLYLDNILIKDGAIPNLVPTVEFIAPVEDMIITDDLPVILDIQLLASDEDGFISEVVLGYEGLELQVFDSEPYQFVIEIEEYGIYTLHAIAIDNETAVSDTALLVVTVQDIGTAAIEISDSNVKLFPNPASDHVVFSAEDVHSCESMKIEIRDVSGKVVLLRQFDSGNEAIIQLGDLVPGTYNFRAEVCDSIFRETIIISR